MPAARVLNRHAALVNHMAEVAGVDMTAALGEARLTREGWATAVMACVGCARPDACDQWLADQRGPEGLPERLPVAQLPSYCRNAGLIAGLAQREGERDNGRDDA
ncbi:DUF6455 family protein [Phaeovulum sp. W22_SRMD_FR3]|uniref:DUF6455 family protein n=1 Tax=Phaeovulum sp. W22_SRMD_FR3 TaxID=3240274 RepID=UPI003F976633